MLHDLNGHSDADTDVLAFAPGLDADYRYVQRIWRQLGGQPVHFNVPRLARQLPTLEDAARHIVSVQGREPDTLGVMFEDSEIDGPESALPVRLYSRYRPEAVRPVILTFGAGHWVNGDVTRYDCVPRMLAHRTGALVVSVGVRQAPEHPFPAAHADAWAAWRWLFGALPRFGGDARRVGLFGEAEGANLALNVALKAKAAGLRQPVQTVLAAPIVDAGADHADPELIWSKRHLMAEGAEPADERLMPTQRADLAGLGPVSLIAAAQDPARAQADALFKALQGAGVSADMETYDGVGSGFFRLGLVVTKSLFAQSRAATAFNAAFITARAKAA
jgi:acetyl esterase